MTSNRYPFPSGIMEKVGLEITSPKTRLGQPEKWAEQRFMANQAQKQWPAPAYGKQQSWCAKPSFQFSSPSSGHFQSKGLWQPQASNGYSNKPSNGRARYGSNALQDYSSSKWDGPHGQAHAVPHCSGVQRAPELPPLQMAKPFFMQLRHQYHWWVENTKNPEVLTIIQQGVAAPGQLPSKLSLRKCYRSKQETQLALETLEEYLAVGAVKEVPPWEAKHLIPWFVIQKGES